MITIPGPTPKQLAATTYRDNCGRSHQIVETITAVPAGRNANGQPITRRVTYRLTRSTREPWSRPGSVRIFHATKFGSTPAVVMADSIEVV